MLNIAGTDGCRAGWLCLIQDLDTGRIGSKIFPTFAELAETLAVNRIAIDIPIGLSDSGPRSCDVEARRLLGPVRGSSVFPAPIRALLKAGDYPTTNALSQRVYQKGVSAQAHAIYAKVAEVDDVLRARPELRDRVVEVHPEVTFAHWQGAPIVESKKTKEGRAIRRALIDRQFGTDAFEAVRHRYKRAEAADDDILDAFAALHTAARIVSGEAVTIPSPPQRDSAGLPMRIVY
jgi:predicted RNase H-like nuclease